MGTCSVSMGVLVIERILFDEESFFLGLEGFNSELKTEYFLSLQLLHVLQLISHISKLLGFSIIIIETFHSYFYIVGHYILMLIR